MPFPMNQPEKVIRLWCDFHKCFLEAELDAEITQQITIGEDNTQTGFWIFDLSEAFCPQGVKDTDITCGDSWEVQYGTLLQPEFIMDRKLD
jgi:hypothetical protein